MFGTDDIKSCYCSAFQVLTVTSLHGIFFGTGYSTERGDRSPVPHSDVASPLPVLQRPCWILMSRYQRSFFGQGTSGKHTVLYYYTRLSLTVNKTKQVHSSLIIVMFPSIFVSEFITQTNSTTVLCIGSIDHRQRNHRFC